MKRQHSEKGAALVELAIVMPVLLLILTAIAEYGLLFRTFEITTNAVREGARLAALPGNEQDDYAIVHDRVDSYLDDAQLPGDRTITVLPEAIAIGGLTANGVRVTVNYTYDTVFLGLAASLLNGSFTNSVTYQSTALMRVQVAAVAP